MARAGPRSTASRRPARPSCGSGSRRRRRPWPPSPTTPTTRSASSSAAPTLIRRVAARAAWFEAIVDLPLAEAYARLTAVPGHRAVDGRRGRRSGRSATPDAVSVGDFHLPNLVAFALAGEPRGDDARMLELLEPYRGQRARVIRLLELSGI